MLQLIGRYAAEGAFSPEELMVLVAAFDAAWSQLEKSGAQLSERRKEEARGMLAKSIIAEAKKGERDVHRLQEAALLHYAQSNLRETPRK
jgi:hypothetical protein